MKHVNSLITFFDEYEEEMLKSDKNDAVIIVWDNTEAYYGEEGSCNIQYCEEHNIPYKQHKIKIGGCIVSSKGSVGINLKMIANGGKAILDQMTTDFSNYLISKGLNSVRTDNNDILIDGYKVASGVETLIDKWEYMGFQVAVNQDIDAIKNICNKSMVKIPKALSEYGITTEDVVSYFENWCKSHGIE